MLTTHKTSITYFEHCKIVVSDEKLCFIKGEEALEKHWSIPYGATACLLLGPGTSVTQTAAKFLGSEGIMVGFTGGGGAPLFFSSQNEYRSTEYLQKWVHIWQSPVARLKVAKVFYRKRVELVSKSIDRYKATFELETFLSENLEAMIKASSINQLMSFEAVLAKRLYKEWSLQYDTKFKRDHSSKDPVNRYLSNGNYLAYGLASTTLWVLGIPHGLPVTHGQTRRGGLVFDVADIIKDACILPTAFYSNYKSEDSSSNRKRCIEALDDINALNILFSTIKEACDQC